MGSGRNKKLPPRRIPTVGKVQKVLSTRTQQYCRRRFGFEALSILSFASWCPSYWTDVRIIQGCPDSSASNGDVGKTSNDD